MSLEENKALARRSIDLWGHGNTDMPEAVFAESYINHQEPDVEGGATTRDLASWKKLVTDFHKAFTNSVTDNGLQIAEGDRVATRFEFSATHDGEYMGVAPTGKQITWTGIEIDRIENGKIVESWVDWDKYRFFQGLGLAK